MAGALGFVVLLCAGYAVYHRLPTDQLWIFQRLIGFVALGLLVIAFFGSVINDAGCRALNRLDGWIDARPSRAGFLLAFLITAYFVAWCSVSFLRHHYFHSSYDLAIMDQVVWNTSQGRWFARSIEEGITNDLGDHVRLNLAALSVFYLLVPSPYVLLTFQSLVLALSALPLYKIARRKFDSPGIGLAAACCALAYPPLGFLNRYDFHIEVLSIPLLIAAYDRIDVADLKSASVLMALTLFTKENLGLTLAMVGIVAGLSYKHWRFGLAWVFIGVAYSLIALLVVIPAFRGAPSDTLERYNWLGHSPSQMVWGLLSHPVLGSERIFAAGHVLTLLQLFAPLAFVPLLGLTALLPAVPTLVYNFLADWSAQTTIYNHYMAPVIPFMLLAGVTGLHYLVRRAWLGRMLNVPSGSFCENAGTGLVVAVMLIATLTSWMYENPITGNSSLVWGRAPETIPLSRKTAVPMVWSNDAAIREGLTSVPYNRPLLTTSNYAPHLSHRRWIEMIPMAPVSSLPPQAEVIFLNLNDLRWWSCEDYFETLKMARQLNFGVTFYRDSVILVQKTKGDIKTLPDLLTHWPGCK